MNIKLVMGRLDLQGFKWTTQKKQEAEAVEG